MTLHSLTHACSIDWMVLGTLFASTNNASCAFRLLVMDDDVWIDVRSWDNISRYLLYLLELLLAHVLMMCLGNHLLTCVGCSTTHRHHWLPTLVNLVLLLSLHWLRIVYIVAIHRWLWIIVSIILHIAVVDLRVKGLFGCISRKIKNKTILNNLLQSLLLQGVLILKVNRLLLPVIDPTYILDELIVLWYFLLVILGRLQFQIHRSSI